MQAAHHWEVLAYDIVNEIGLQLEHSSVLPYERFYVSGIDKSTFGKALRSLLITELNERGYPVVFDPDGALEINWSTQIVQHRSGREKPMIPFKNTAYAALGLGVWKVFESLGTAPGVGAALGAFALAADFEAMTFSGELPHSEILVNVSFMKGEELFERMTNLYYVNDLDTDHYWNTADISDDTPELEKKRFDVVDR
jgi:hypothetical protein